MATFDSLYLKVRCSHCCKKLLIEIVTNEVFEIGFMCAYCEETTEPEDIWENLILKKKELE